MQHKKFVHTLIILGPMELLPTVDQINRFGRFTQIWINFREQ